MIPAHRWRCLLLSKCSSVCCWFCTAAVVSHSLGSWFCQMNNEHLFQVIAQMLSLARWYSTLPLYDFMTSHIPLIQPSFKSKTGLINGESAMVCNPLATGFLLVSPWMSHSIPSQSASPPHGQRLPLTPVHHTMLYSCPHCASVPMWQA